MVRTSGGGAAGAIAAMEQRDKAAIKTRTRASNELTVPKVEVPPLGEFPDPPGRRLTPWTKENASGTDIVIGSVDEKGFFSGLMVSEVHMQALFRFFKMAQTYMPRDAPTGLESLAEQMANGLAVVVVTRGTYGREAEAGTGPKSNDARPMIWDAVRDARVLNPSLHITCLDVPTTITGQQLSKVLTQPLSNHRELAFYEGVWYAPEINESLPYAKQMQEYNTFTKTKPLWHTRVNAAKSQSQIFNRKSFPWRENVSPVFVKTWTQVFTDEDYVKTDTPAIARDFTGPTIHNRASASIQDLGGADGE
jgi:hypothetical protein